jgi:hypothetical protein
MKSDVYVRRRLPPVAVACMFLSFWPSVFPAMAQEQAADQQQSDPAPGDAPISPLTPVIQRDQEIKQYDPLAKSDADIAAQVLRERQAAKRGQEDNSPIPGSIADSQKQATVRESRVAEKVAESVAPAPEFAGPAVLTRSYTLGQPSIPKTLKWTERISVGNSFDTGVGNIGQYGPGTSGSLAGTQASWSISGGHAFQRDSIGFSSTGGFALFPGSSDYNGGNHNLSAFWSHTISRRLSMSTSFGGMITSANAALSGWSAGPESIANVNLAASPDIGVFDNGSKQGSLSTGVSWIISSRWSVGFNGSYFGVVRDSAALYGMSGITAAGTISHRLTRKMTVGANYSFSQYMYPHGTQTSDVRSIGAIFSYSLGRNMQVRFNGGFSGVESLGLETVPIDPIIAAILGVKEGVIDAYHTYGSSNISVQLVRDFRKNGSVSVAYANGISPGNGLFQTSSVKSLSVSYSTRILRKYSLRISGSRDETSAVGVQGLGSYRDDTASISLSQSLTHSTSASFSVDYRHFDISSFSSLRNQLTVSSSFSWSNSNGRLLPF